MNHPQYSLLRQLYRFTLLTSISWLSLLLISAQQESPATIHVVQRGESLFHIALGYHLTVDIIAETNGITNPDNIFVGQRLIIPASTTSMAPKPRVVEHIVQPGETLNQIAAFYELSPDSLIEHNQIANPDSLFIGQVLQLIPVHTITTIDLTNPQIVDLTHTIQPGETLYHIAKQYGKTIQEIQEANEITDSILILSGQPLLIPDAKIPQFAGELPAPLTDLQVSPLIFTEGKTGQIRLTTNTPATVSGSFLGQELIAFDVENRTTNFIIVGIPLGTPQDVYQMELLITSDTGEAARVYLNIQVLSGNYGTQSITLPDDKVNLLSSAIEQNELSILQSVTTSARSERYFNGPISLPIAAVMNAPFGPSRSYNDGPANRYHDGADFIGEPGSSVLAASSGQIVMVDILNIRGLSLIIDHGWGVYTNYSHLDDVFVQLGDFVETGQTIGTIGNSGRVTGTHLHWELRVRGVAVDPMQWVTERFG